MLNRRCFTAAIAALTIGAGTAVPAQAQTYPDRPVTIVVPWGAGGGTDLIVRIFAGGLEKELGQPVNVVNKTGGNGIVGHAAIKDATPDGYTVGAATSEIATFKAMGLSDISPESYDLISRLAILPAGIMVKGDAPHKTLSELLADIKAKPKGSFTASGSGAGGSWHMALAGLLKAAGIETDKVRWVPGTGGAAAIQELTAGGISLWAGAPVEGKAVIESGAIRALAVMGETRSPAVPTAPTVKEAANLDWQFANWFSLVAPKGLPEPVRAKIIAAATKAHARKDVQDALAARGIIPLWDGPEAFKTYATGYTTTAGGLLKDLGLAKN
jgi:tripartite-type tricarboxylate transporter receptor subunit TctC